MNRRLTAGVLLIAVALAVAAAPDASHWKRYRSSEYGFEIAYPSDWHFDGSAADNHAKPASGDGFPVYAGETRDLFGLEKEGPTQSQEGGGEFSDGAIVGARITGPTGAVEDWNVVPGRPRYLTRSAPSDWLRLESAGVGGDGVKKVAISTNGFIGTIAVGCTGSNPCKTFREAGGAYRTLASGRVLLLSWEREAGGNDLSYEAYFLPILSSFKLLQ
jgi:hypothetical protein